MKLEDDRPYPCDPRILRKEFERRNHRHVTSYHLAKKGVVSGTPVDSHADPMPLGVAGFGAPVRDASAVPLIDDRGRDGYRDWLRRPSPRAFVIASNGSWRATWGKTPPGEPDDAAERAMLHCHRSGLKECKLYAVDNAGVWESDSAHK